MEIPWLCFWPVGLNNWAVIYKLWQISKNRYCSLNTQNNEKETSFKRIQNRAFPGEGFTGGLWSAVWDLPNSQILIDLGISCTTFHNRCFWRKKNKFSKIHESWVLLPSFSGNNHFILPNKSICIFSFFNPFLRSAVSQQKFLSYNFL